MNYAGSRVLKFSTDGKHEGKGSPKAVACKGNFQTQPGYPLQRFPCEGRFPKSSAAATAPIPKAAYSFWKLPYGKPHEVHVYTLQLREPLGVMQEQRQTPSSDP